MGLLLTLDQVAGEASGDGARSRTALTADRISSATPTRRLLSAESRSASCARRATIASDMYARTTTGNLAVLLISGVSYACVVACTMDVPVGKGGRPEPAFTSYCQLI